MTPAAILSALLAIYPHGRGRYAVARTRPAIEAQLAAAHAATGVPLPILAAVGWAESHLGTDRASGGSYGAPVSPMRRHVAGNATHAARSLATSYRVCGSWPEAVTRFRTGLCRPRQPALRIVGEAYTRNVLRLAATIEREVSR